MAKTGARVFREKELWVSEIPVILKRKNIKNLHLYVKPPEGRVEVTAPARLSEERILAFLTERLPWIRMQRTKLQKEGPSLGGFRAGEMLYVFGKVYDLELRDGGRGYSLTLDGDRAIFSVRRDSTPEQQEAFLKEWYRILLRVEIETRLPVWEARTGLKSQGFQLRDMTTRWGTCNVNKKTLCFNLQLAKRDLACLDYVILHELAHLKVPNHGPEFKAILDRYMPDWRAVRALLRS